MLANRDQLVQVFLNLVKNAAEAIGDNAPDGEIEFTTAFQPGRRLSVGLASERVSLPLVFCVRDNGPGVPRTSGPTSSIPSSPPNRTGTGLGLALVAKIIGDHGGIVECKSAPRRTVFPRDDADVHAGEMTDERVREENARRSMPTGNILSPTTTRPSAPC